MSYPPQPPPYGQQPGYPPQQGGYPPPPQGYPPQQGYPPTQAGYPPQPGGYPPPQQGGYPPQQPQQYGGPQAPLPQTAAGGPVVHDPNTLPSNDNVNPYAFSVDLNGQYFLQKGKMVAYYGNIQFHGIGHGPLDQLIGKSFHSPLHAADWVVAEGQGKMILADRAFDLNSYDLEEGNLTVRSGNLLAFDPRLSLKQSIIPGFLTLIGTGKFVAASNGPVHFVEPPVRVDPQALVGWADCPSPCHHYDHSYMRGVLGGLRQLTGLGGVSGEEHQFEFIGAGQVLLQSSETLMADINIGHVPNEAGIPGAGAPSHTPQQASQQLPNIPGLGNLGNLGDLGRRFGL